MKLSHAYLDVILTWLPVPSKKMRISSCVLERCLAR